MESIIEQMMNVARYQQWDTIELEPVFFIICLIKIIKY